MIFVQGLERQAQPRGGARCQILHQHIGLLQQAAQYFACVGMLQVECKTFLGTIGPDKMRRQTFDTLVVAPCKVAHTRTLYLDDARSKVRSEEHTSELQSLMRISSALFCLKQTSTHIQTNTKQHANT